MLLDATCAEDPTIVRLSDGFAHVTGYDHKFAAGRAPKFLSLRSADRLFRRRRRELLAFGFSTLEHRREKNGYRVMGIPKVKTRKREYKSEVQAL